MRTRGQCEALLPQPAGEWWRAGDSPAPAVSSSPVDCAVSSTSSTSCASVPARSPGAPVASAVAPSAGT